MPGFRVHDGAGYRLDDVYRYTRDAWGEAQAEHYLNGLFDRFREDAPG